MKFWAEDIGYVREIYSPKSSQKTMKCQLEILLTSSCELYVHENQICRCMSSSLTIHLLLEFLFGIRVHDSLKIENLFDQ